MAREELFQLHCSSENVLARPEGTLQIKGCPLEESHVRQKRLVLTIVWEQPGGTLGSGVNVQQIQRCRGCLSKPPRQALVKGPLSAIATWSPHFPSRSGIMCILF